MAHRVPKGVTKNCKQCGKAFHPSNDLVVFCSVPCYRQHQKEHHVTPTRRVKSRVFTCVNCGVEFHPFKSGAKKFCSRVCMWEHNRKTCQSTSRTTKKCSVCGNDFTPWRSTAKFCSAKCRGIGITAIRKESPASIKNWTRRNTGGQTTHLDNLWRFSVYRKANYACEYCGKSDQLNAHHIFSRSNYAVRWDTDNGVCLCVSHHIFGNTSFHKSPTEMIEWIREKRGPEWYESLREKARKIVKVSEIKDQFFEILKDEQYNSVTRKRMPSGQWEQIRAEKEKKEKTNAC